MELIRYIKNLAGEEDGATAIEYALLGSLIAVAIVTAATALGVKVSDALDFITTSIPTL